jgi:hypothetical protein
MSAAEAAAVQGYLARQRELQRRLSAGLDPEQVSRNQRLIWLWDFLSLGLCLGWEGNSLDGVTLREGTIDPWPLRADTVTLRAEGRRLAGRFDDEAGMRAALEAAPWVELRFELARG